MQWFSISRYELLLRESTKANPEANFSYHLKMTGVKRSRYQCSSLIYFMDFFSVNVSFFLSPQVTPQCKTHHVLSSADRSINSYLSFSTQVKSDRNLPQGWYRFSGAAGSKMPERRQVPGLYSCGTYGPGWLAGRHPKQPQQTVRALVCYRWGYSRCRWGSYVWITNCGNFFVYYLYPTPTNSFYLRYCGTPWIREKDTSDFVDWSKVSLNSFTVSSFNIKPKRETNQCKFDPIWYRNGPFTLTILAAAILAAILAAISSTISQRFQIARVNCWLFRGDNSQCKWALT